MATAQQFQDAVARLNTATSAAGAKITELKDKLAAGGLTDTEEAAVLDELGAVAASLEAMAVDPVDPVPIPLPPLKSKK